MFNEGSQVEHLVRTIEKSLLPKGFEVLGNERIFNDAGVQIAEFDIHIRGNIGSTLFNWLVECRDRPTEGPSPASWIEQLVGRRDRFNFNKVTAVSTTGYSPGAIEYANEKGIELRTVKEITIEDVRDWFLSSFLYVMKKCGNLLHTEIHIQETDPKIREEVKEVIAEAGVNEPVLIRKDTDEILSMVEILRREMNAQQIIFSGVTADKRPILRTIRLHCSEENCFQLRLHAGFVNIILIIFVVELSIRMSTVPISKIIRYDRLGDGYKISETIQFSVEIENKGFNFSIHKIEKDNGIFWGIQTTPSVKKDN